MVTLVSEGLATLKKEVNEMKQKEMNQWEKPILNYLHLLHLNLKLNLFSKYNE
jgi:hypothetical protein